VGSTFKLAHGRTNAVLLPHVVRYNGSIPSKLTAWPKYEHYVAPERFQQIAAMLGLPAATPAEGVESYAVALEALRSKIGIPASFAAWGVSESDFIGRLDELALGSFEDQCAPANPRMPMREDMKDLMAAAYYGTSFEDFRSIRAGRDPLGTVPDPVVVGAVGEAAPTGATAQGILTTS
jgi:acetaldehyde dehydrogenase/alcohol dehydrogenase